VKRAEKEEKLDGDAAANKFFQDIFHNTDEDMRRAMTKSFQESNGTVLSTNWKDVADGAAVGREQACEIRVGWLHGWIGIGGLRCATGEGSRFCRL